MVSDMNKSNHSSNELDRADIVGKALSTHNQKALRRLMKDATRHLANPEKWNIDDLPKDDKPITDRRKRRKAKEDETK